MLIVVGGSSRSHDWPDTKICQQEQHGPPGRRKLGKLLSSQHYILLEMYMSLIALYEKREDKPDEPVRKMLVFSRMFQRE